MANTCYVLVILAAGILVMTRETVQVRYGIGELAPRLVIGLVAANLATPLCSGLINLANGLTGALTEGPIAGPGAAEQLSRVVTSALNDITGVGRLLVVVIAMLILALTVLLFLTFLVRIGVLVALVGIAPAALACHGLPQLDSVARFWWRSLLATLGTVTAQGLLLHEGLTVFLSPQANLPSLGLPVDPDGIVNLFIVVCLLWTTVKIPSVLARIAARGGTRTPAEPPMLGVRRRPRRWRAQADGWTSRCPGPGSGRYRLLGLVRSCGEAAVDAACALELDVVDVTKVTRILEPAREHERQTPANAATMRRRPAQPASPATLTPSPPPATHPDRAAAAKRPTAHHRAGGGRRPPRDDGHDPWSDPWLSVDDWAEAFEASEAGTAHDEARHQILDQLLTILMAKHDGDVSARQVAYLDRTGVAAVAAGHKVRYLPAADLAEHLYRAMADNTVRPPTRAPDHDHSSPHDPPGQGTEALTCGRVGDQHDFNPEGPKAVSCL